MTRSDAVCLLGGAGRSDDRWREQHGGGVDAGRYACAVDGDADHAPYALPSYLFVSLIGCGLGAVLATRRAMPKPMPRSGEGLGSGDIHGPRIERRFRSRRTYAPSS
jgi:hypothetical protein